MEPRLEVGACQAGQRLAFEQVQHFGQFEQQARHSVGAAQPASLSEPACDLRAQQFTAGDLGLVADQPDRKGTLGRCFDHLGVNADSGEKRIDVLRQEQLVQPRQRDSVPQQPDLCQTIHCRRADAQPPRRRLAVEGRRQGRQFGMVCPGRYPPQRITFDPGRVLKAGDAADAQAVFASTSAQVNQRRWVEVWPSICWPDASG